MAKTAIKASAVVQITDEQNLCDICVTNERFYTCPSCKCKMCKACIKHYIMTYANLSPHCLQCQTLLPFNVLYHSLGKNGLNEFFKQSASLKFELELQKSPESMECCNEILISKRINVMPFELVRILSTCCNFRQYSLALPGSKLEEFTNEFDDIIFDARIQALQQLRMIYFPGVTPKSKLRNNSELMTVQNKMIVLSNVDHIHDDYIERLDEELKHFTTLTADDFIRIGDVNNLANVDTIVRRHEYHERNKDLGRADKNEFVFKCSNGDCKGLVDTNYICRICRKKYCKDCFQMLDSNVEHVCDKNDIECAKEILSSTKACPNCGVRIFKISGCSQMFCTNCHVGFDWNTNKIIKSNFHNPHRLAWLRQNNLSDDSTVGLCNNQGNAMYLLRQAVQQLARNYEFQRRIQELHHFTDKVREYQQKINSIDKDLFKNRCLYLINDLNKKDYIAFLNKNVKTHHRLGMIYNIYDDYVEIIRTIMISAADKYNNFAQSLNKVLTDNAGDHMCLVSLWTELESNYNMRLVKQLFETDEYDKALGKMPLWQIFSKHLERAVINGKNTNGIMRNSNILLDDTHIKIYTDVFKDAPNFQDDIELMDKITDETRNEIKLYKSIFSIGKLTMPVTSISANVDYEKSNHAIVTYYEVC